MRRWPLLAVAGLVLVAGAGVLATGNGVDRRPSGERTRASEASAQAAQLLGQHLPSLIVTDLRGDSIDALTGAAGKYTLVMLLREDDCLSCVDFPLEAKVVRNRFPVVHPILVGVGPDTAFFASYFRRTRTEGFAGIDRTQRLFALLGTTHTPLVLLVDPERRVVFVDIRAGPAVSAQPISRILASLAVLDDT